MKGKRLLSFLLTLCMALSLVPVTAFAAEPETVSVLTCDYEYEHIHKEGSCTWKNCNHKEGHLTTCYSESVVYAPCTHNDKAEHTASVNISDVVTYSNWKLSWSTSHPAYGVVKAYYDSLVEWDKLKILTAKFCYTVSTSATPDKCTHGDCSEVAGACYTKCLLIEHTHTENCWKTLVKTTLELNEGVEVTYGISENNLKELLVDGVYDSNGTEVTVGDVEFVTDVDRLNAGDAVEVTLKYNGVDGKYAPDEATTTIKINKAPAFVTVNDTVVKYGKNIDMGIDVTEGCKAITLVAGLDVADAQVDSEGNISGVDMKLELILPDWSAADFGLPEWMEDIFGSVEDYLEDVIPEEGAELSVAQVIALMKELNGASDAVTNDAVAEIETALNQLGGLTDSTMVDDIKITVSKNLPSDIGVYLVSVVTADKNYETAADMGVLAITPEGKKVELGWKHHDENGAVAYEALDSYDLGAEVTKVYEGDKDEAAEKLQVVFFGVDKDGNIILTQKQTELNLGVYAETAFIADFGNEMYYAEPIARVLAVVPRWVDVEFEDGNNDRLFTYNGKAQEMKAFAEGDGTLTVRYVGISGDGEGYNSTTPPSKVGAYAVTATYVEYEDDVLVATGFAVGAMVIEKAASDFALYEEGITTDYTGYPVDVEILVKNKPEGTEVLYVVVNEANEVNEVSVILPDALTELMPALAQTTSVDFAVVKAEMNGLIEAARALQLPEGFAEKLEVVLTEMETVLANVPDATVAINAYPVEIGAYDVHAVTYSETEKSVYVNESLAIKPIELTITVEDQAIYRSASINQSKYSYTDTLLDGDKLENVTLKVDGNKITVDTYKITDAEGNDVAEHYNVKVDEGNLSYKRNKNNNSSSSSSSKDKESSVEEKPTEEPTTNTVPTSPSEVVEEEALILTINDTKVDAFGNVVHNDVAPIIKDNRTMLPIRVVAENLGATVTWSQAEQKVTITKDETVIEIFIGSSFAVVNGELVQLDAVAFIENGRTYLPIRFVAENLGATVLWEAETQKVYVVPVK